MGVSAKSNLILYVAIMHSDLFNRGVVVAKCRSGHRGDPNHRFCPSCGNKMEAVNEDSPNTRYLAYAEEFHLNKDLLWSRCLDEITTRDTPILTPVPMVVNKTVPVPTDEEVMGLGILLGERPRLCDIIAGSRRLGEAAKQLDIADTTVKVVVQTVYC